MARVFSSTMSKYKGKRAKNLSKFANKSLIYAILTGLSGVITSVFMKSIRSNVKICGNLYSITSIFIFILLVNYWANWRYNCKLFNVVRTDKMLSEEQKHIRSKFIDSVIKHLFLSKKN